MWLRRSGHSEKEKEMLRKIKTEYSLFRYRMLSGSVQKVYDACQKICFYECINEYFWYSREINADFINATGQSDKILAELWEIYLKNEKQWYPIFVEAVMLELKENRGSLLFEKETREYL